MSDLHSRNDEYAFKHLTTQEYCKSGTESGSAVAFRSEWRLFASQRPIAPVAASGSAKFRLPTCD
jgi:hypothetical protein